ADQNDKGHSDGHDAEDSDLIGGIDLSVGSALAIAMMVMGWTANVAGLPLPVGIAFALVAAGLSGLIVGLLVTQFRVPA
ncbi:hypothetical protein AB9F45_39225, partial [Rhizobium leguminosarum]